VTFSVVGNTRSGKYNLRLAQATARSINELLRTLECMSGGGQRTTSTEQPVRCTMPPDTLPDTKRLSPVRPWVLSTMRS